MNKINLEFTIDEVNELLAILGEVPYVKSSKFIAYIITTGKPQADAILEKQSKIDLNPPNE